MKETIGIGIIGTGFGRHVQIPAFLACDDARIASVASSRLENARETADACGAEHYTSDWRETVAHADVDLVCITTPPLLHREMVLFAVEQEKHILCEKPMAMNVAEAVEMTEAAKSVGVLALIDHELRFQQGRQTAYAMLRMGEIGKVRHARYMFQAPHRGDATLPWNWWSDADAGGGSHGAIVSHIIDSFHWLLGTQTASVSCQLQTHIKERKDAAGLMRPVTSDDQSIMMLRFADSPLTEDATGLVSVSMTEGPKFFGHLEFFGSEGVMRLTNRGRLSVARNGEPGYREIEIDLGSAIDGVPDTGFSRGFMAFAPRIIESIREGHNLVENAATFEDGLLVQKVLDAGRESDATGRVISI